MGLERETLLTRMLMGFQLVLIKQVRNLGKHDPIPMTIRWSAV